MRLEGLKVKRRVATFERTICAPNAAISASLKRNPSLLTGKSASYIAHLENAKRIPSDRVLGKLAFGLGLDTRELLLRGPAKNCEVSET